MKRKIFVSWEHRMVVNLMLIGPFFMLAGGIQLRWLVNDWNRGVIQYGEEKIEYSQNPTRFNRTIAAMAIPPGLIFLAGLGMSIYVYGIKRCRWKDVGENLPEEGPFWPPREASADRNVSNDQKTA